MKKAGSARGLRPERTGSLRQRRPGAAGHARAGAAAHAHGSGGRRLAAPTRFAGDRPMARRSRRPGFADAGWMVATVPGTVLVSYLNAGAIPDPNFGDNQLMISDSFFQADFWYRNEFTRAGVVRRKKRLAEFRRHQLEGRGLSQWREAGPYRGRFTARPVRRDREAAAGGKNALAVRVIRKSRTPAAIKEKHLRIDRQERRRARRRQSHFPRVHRLGLDPDHSRARRRASGARCS